MNKPRLSIEISAFNEAGNIAKLLHSVLGQEQKDFSILEIFVYSDASTDSTVEEVKKISDPRITVYSLPERTGKSYHLNQFFREALGDILVFFDADVILDNQQVLARLIDPIRGDSKVGLVGGNAQSQPGRTFMENAINVTCRAFDKVRIHFNGGNNPFGANGCIMALSKAFASLVNIPEDMIANDQFLYFFCLSNNFKFVHQRSAIVWYRSPTTLQDHIKQNSRFIASHRVMANYFSEAAHKEYAVPKAMLYKFLLIELLQDPIHAIYIFLVNRYCAYKANLHADEMNSKWDMAMSTKEGVGNAK